MFYLHTIVLHRIPKTARGTPMDIWFQVSQSDSEYSSRNKLEARYDEEEDTLTFFCAYQLPVKEDFKVEFFNSTLFGKTALFWCWFNTRFLREGKLLVTKKDLDAAYKDKRNKIFARDLHVELHFAETSLLMHSDGLSTSPHPQQPGSPKSMSLHSHSFLNPATGTTIHGTRGKTAHSYDGVRPDLPLSQTHESSVSLQSIKPASSTTLETTPTPGSPGVGRFSTSRHRNKHRRMVTSGGSGSVTNVSMLSNTGTHSEASSHLNQRSNKDSELSKSADLTGVLPSAAALVDSSPRSVSISLKPNVGSPRGGSVGGAIHRTRIPPSTSGRFRVITAQSQQQNADDNGGDDNNDEDELVIMLDDVNVEPDSPSDEDDGADDVDDGDNDGDGDGDLNSTAD